MTLLGGRGGRTDDWKTPHLRARARAAERLEGPLDPAEEAWLDEHLAECTACAATAADYATQRLELRALRDRQPLPPRDLWARTAAAIEREAGPASRRGRRSTQSLLAPYALLAGAVIVAVAVGSLSIAPKGPIPSVASTASVAGGSGQPTNAAATPILVGPDSVAYLTQTYGQLHFNHLQFSHVCGPTTNGCETLSPNDTQTIGPVASPDTVFGAGDRPLVVVSNGDGSGGKVYAIAVATQEPAATPTPTASSSTTASPPPSAPSPTPPPTSPPATASAPPAESISPTAPPSEAPSEPPSASPSASSAVVEIARDLKVLDTTAAYAPDGSAFAFTARPDDGSHGPDIYLWHVGDAKAAPITTDHRSVFGSWSGASIVGSTVTAGPNGRLERPLAFVIGPGATEPTLQPQTGLAWRPVVDPHGRAAVYWSGRLEPTDDGLGWTTRSGKLVVGRWDDVTASAAPAASSSPAASSTTTVTITNDATSSPDESATAADDAAQPQNRSETTIATGPLSDWDARWDITGTRLAVWIADPNNPTVGLLSLYVVDPFNGKIDLSKPPLENKPAMAGFALADGHLAWAAPPKDGSSESSVLVLAWTGDEFGQVESAPGDILLVR
ncbi:MAG TPA: zf-HC2 domain-containing protein [Candidatus Dormibacteraeota bacterium]|nr:zf-HC2 domain-containing protein [Candidatus Dormibacteraeota bacterium]